MDLVGPDGRVRKECPSRMPNATYWSEMVQKQMYFCMYLFLNS